MENTNKLWNYAEHSKKVKEFGGPDKYEYLLKLKGFKNGILIMLPICGALLYNSIQQDKNILNLLKEKFPFFNKKEKEFDEQANYVLNNFSLTCPECHTTSYGLHMISNTHGFTKDENGKITPNIICKACNTYKRSIH